MKPAAAPRFAPLTGGLLARKGEARPAMRSGAGDDLGWNDMGAAPAFQPSVITAASADAALPPPGKIRAFTLRLTAERHLRLRRACALTHSSAQALVTQALDAMLDAVPALDAPAESCPAETPGRKARGAIR